MEQECVRVSTRNASWPGCRPSDLRGVEMFVAMRSLAHLRGVSERLPLGSGGRGRGLDGQRSKVRHGRDHHVSMIRGGKADHVWSDRARGKAMAATSNSRPTLGHRPTIAHSVATRGI